MIPIPQSQHFNWLQKCIHVGNARFVFQKLICELFVGSCCLYFSCDFQKVHIRCIICTFPYYVRFRVLIYIHTHMHVYRCICACVCAPRVNNPDCSVLQTDLWLFSINVINMDCLFCGSTALLFTDELHGRLVRIYFYKGYMMVRFCFFWAMCRKFD